MKHLILSFVLLVSLLCVARPGRAQTAAEPLDSVAERQIVQRISASICTELQQENQKKPLASFSKDEATQLFTRLMMSAAAAEPALLARFAQDPGNAHAYGEQLGRRIGLRLIQECEVSRPLFQSMSEQGATQFKPAGTDETKLVNSLASEVCTGILPRQKQLKGMTPAQRLQVISGQLETSFKAHAKEIQQLYGSNAMEDSEKLRALGTKVGYQAAQQCPAIMQVLSGGK